MSRKPVSRQTDKVADTDNTPGNTGNLRSLSGPILVALLCASVLMITHLLTAQRISHNESQQSQKQLRMLLGDLVPAQLLDAVNWSSETKRLCVADLLVVQHQTNGYAGSIDLLLAIRQEQPPVLAAITVTRHLETPGIADFLAENAPLSWLTRLHDLSADSLSGVDTVTGATISSRAVLHGAARALQKAGERSECAP